MCQRRAWFAHQGYRESHCSNLNGKPTSRMQCLTPIITCATTRSPRYSHVFKVSAAFKRKKHTVCYILLVFDFMLLFFFQYSPEVYGLSPLRACSASWLQCHLQHTNIFEYWSLQQRLETLFLNTKQIKHNQTYSPSLHLRTPTKRVRRLQRACLFSKL